MAIAAAAILLVALLAGSLSSWSVTPASAATTILYPNGPGDTPVGQGIPNNKDGENAAQSFTGVPVAGPARWANLDDSPSHDGDTSYVETTGDDHGDLYTLTNPAFATGTVINSIQLCAVMRRADTDQRGGFVGLKSGTTESWGTKVEWPGIGSGNNTPYAQYCRTYATDPHTGAAWTKAGVDALQVGFFSNNDSNSGLRATQIFVTVDYGTAASSVSSVSSISSVSSPASPGSVSSMMSSLSSISSVSSPGSPGSVSSISSVSSPGSPGTTSSMVSSVSSVSSAPPVGQCPAGTLMAHWKFDEGSGTQAQNAVSGGVHGTHENGPAHVTGATVLSHNPWAASYDGIDDRTRVAGTHFAFGTGSFTVSAFLRPEEGGRGVLGTFGPVTGGHRGWGLFLDPDGRVNFFGYGDGGTHDTAHASSVLNGQWHHVAGVYERNGSDLTIRTYVDGVLIGTHTAPVGSIASPHDLLLGGYQLQPGYRGALDDVRIYGRALSAAEVGTLADGCPGGGSSVSSGMSSVSSASSVSSVPPVGGPAPQCNGKTATIYVRDGIIVGGRDDGDVYDGKLRGTFGDDVIVGTEGPDDIKGRSGNDVICGLGGDDSIDGGFGHDWMDGGSGNDTLRGGMGEDILYGREGDDDLDGGMGHDKLFGGPGKDRIDGRMGEDVACGGAGDDILLGGMGDDRMDGGGGTNALDGGMGEDQCVNAASTLRCEVLTGTVPECAGE